MNQQVRPSPAPDGTVRLETNRFTLLENNLQYVDNGQWKLSEDVIESFPNGAVARRGPDQAVFANDLNTEAAFDVLASNGKHLRGGLRAIQATDLGTGKSVVLATVKAKAPAQLFPPNRLAYIDCLDGLKVDLVLEWRHNQFSHDVILRQQPRLPADWNPGNVRLEVVTEFFVDADPELRSQVRSEDAQLELQDDVVIHFGALAMLMGKAFQLDDQSGFSLGGQLRSDQGTPVLKQWHPTPDGRRFLIESVKWSEVLPQIKGLPLVADAAMPRREVTLARAWPERVTHQAERKPVEIASVAYEPKGYLLDFHIVPDWEQPITFLSGEVYVIRTTYYNGTSASFQPGCIIKRWSDNGAALMLYGSIFFPNTTPLCVFTSLDDDSYGGHFAGNSNPYLPASDGDPSAVFDDALKIWYVNYSTDVNNALFRWAQAGIEFWSTGPSADHTVRNCRFEWLANGFDVGIDLARTLTLINSSQCAVRNESYIRPGGRAISGSLTLDCKETGLSMDQLQHETSITIDPSNPNRVAVFAAHNSGGPGLFYGTSANGGVSWPTQGLMATGSSPPQASHDPSGSFDKYGNLFLVYVQAGSTNIVLLLSTDGGQTWSNVTSFPGSGSNQDRPVVATGPGLGTAGSIWVLFQSNGVPHIAGIAVNGLGLLGTTWTSYDLPSTSADPIGTGLAIGPSGQVAMALESRTEPTTSDRKIFVTIDPDGLGTTSATSYITIPANMANQHRIPAQLQRGVFRCPLLAWDRAGNGSKLYLAYTDTPPTDPDGNNTDVYIRSAGSPYTAFSSALTVNDDRTTKSQFLAGLAVDQTSGRIAASWYDCRNDLSGNTLTQFFAAVSSTGFATQPQNIQLTSIQSDGSANFYAACGPGGFDFCCTGSQTMNYGDYTGLAFHAGIMVPAWCSYGTASSRCGDTRLCRISW